jgi:hypothetical protein
MSHLVQIRTRIRDLVALAAACRRLGLANPVYGTIMLLSSQTTGWRVQLPGWRSPVVIDVTTGQITYDHHEGSCGDARELSRFVQAYTCEKAKIEACRRGRSVIEQRLPYGPVKLTIRRELEPQDHQNQRHPRP